MFSVLKVMLSAVAAFLVNVSGVEAFGGDADVGQSGGYDGLSPMAKAF